jgi:hypothetical protein
MLETNIRQVGKYSNKDRMNESKSVFSTPSEASVSIDPTASVKHSVTKDELASNETRNVNRFRVVIAIVLILSTITMAVTIYFFVKRSEINIFRDMFDADANKVLDGLGESIKSNLGAMDAFASMMVSTAKHTNQTFPFVTIPTFAIKASKLLTLCDGFALTTQTVVNANQRLKWEAYTMENQGWVNETKEVQELDVFYNDVVTYGDEHPSTIFGLNGTLPYGEG